MGLLDDAIREHLDLKRRRGADPGEVERATREALGPVRRQPQGADELAFDDEGALVDDSAAYDEEPGHRWDQSLGEHDELEPHTLTDDYEPLPDFPEHGREPYEPPVGPPAAYGVVAPEPGEGYQPPHRSGELDSETAEYDVEHELDAAEEDVLEETPDFLQDAPDHDRLWFEQRPPRDFNFDS